jgi:hypothetical protein
MTVGPMDMVLLAGGGFGGAIINPLLAMSFLAIGLLLGGSPRVRWAGAAVAACLGAFESLGAPLLEMALAALGGALAGLLLAEIWLVLVLPGLRFARNLGRALLAFALGGPAARDRLVRDRDAD